MDELSLLLATISAWRVIHVQSPEEILMKGHRVLIVEDEILIALELQQALTDASATVVGPAMTVLDALHLIDTDSLTAAILDVRLGREESLPVAQRLAADGIPFVLYTANFFGRQEPPPTWPPVPTVRKPADAATLLARLQDAVSAKHEGFNSPW